MEDSALNHLLAHLEALKMWALQVRMLFLETRNTRRAQVTYLEIFGTLPILAWVALLLVEAGLRPILLPPHPPITQTPITIQILMFQAHIIRVPIQMVTPTFPLIVVEGTRLHCQATTAMIIVTTTTMEMVEDLVILWLYSHFSLVSSWLSFLYSSYTEEGKNGRKKWGKEANLWLKFKNFFSLNQQLFPM